MTKYNKLPSIQILGTWVTTTATIKIKTKNKRKRKKREWYWVRRIQMGNVRFKVQGHMSKVMLLFSFFTVITLCMGLVTPSALPLINSTFFWRNRSQWEWQVEDYWYYHTELNYFQSKAKTYACVALPEVFVCFHRLWILVGNIIKPLSI